MVGLDSLTPSEVEIIERNDPEHVVTDLTTLKLDYVQRKSAEMAVRNSGVGVVVREGVRVFGGSFFFFIPSLQKTNKKKTQQTLILEYSCRVLKILAQLFA